MDEPTEKDVIMCAIEMMRDSAYKPNAIIFPVSFKGFRWWQRLCAFFSKKFSDKLSDIYIENLINGQSNKRQVE